MAALGGYQQWHVGTNVDLSQLRHGAWVTLQAFLELFGANVFGTSNFGVNHPIEVVFVWLHLAGAITVICALGVAIRRFFGAELIVPTFAVAILLNLAAYMISTHAQDLLGAREIAPVLPLGAVLAGRTYGDRYRRGRGRRRHGSCPCWPWSPWAIWPRSATAPRRRRSCRQRAAGQLAGRPPPQ